MRSKKYQLLSGTRDASQSCDVQQEINDFLWALRSYPESFAHNPRLSFEQHLFRVMASEVAGVGEHRAS
jgi:hypothetical protein